MNHQHQIQQNQLSRFLSPPYSFPTKQFPPTTKQDKLRTFTPIILFHEHTYKNDDTLECVRINTNDEFQGPLIRSARKRIDNMLEENSISWTIIFKKTREHERRSRDFRQPSLLSNTIYQDQIEGNLSMKPKRRRGNLPKTTTALLKEWLAQHKKHPYPTEEEKLLLAKKCELSLQQISNWFINARRRHLPHLLESEYTGNSMNSSKSTTRELDIYPYEASDNSAEDSDGTRRFAKCPRISKIGAIKKPYMRTNKRKAVI